MIKKLSQLYISQAIIFFRDRTTLIITLILPIVLAVFFALIFRPTDYSLRITIVDADKSSLSSQLIMSVENESEGKVSINLKDESDARLSLIKAETDVVIAFEKGAGNAFLSGEATPITVLYDPSRVQSAGVGLQVARSLISEINIRATNIEPLFTIREDTMLSEQHTLAEFYLPNFLALSVLWIGLFATTLPIVKDRKAMILLRMGATPLSPLLLVVSLTLWRLSVGIIQTIVFLAAGIGILGLPFPSNPVLLVLAVVVGNLVFISMGFMISGLASSEENANTIAQIFNFPMMFLSGIFFTSDMLPDIINKISFAIPLTYLADLYRQILVGYPGSFSIILCFVVLIGFGLICVTISLKTWRWR